MNYRKSSYPRALEPSYVQGPGLEPPGTAPVPRRLAEPEPHPEEPRALVPRPGKRRRPRSRPLTDIERAWFRGFNAAVRAMGRLSRDGQTVEDDSAEEPA